MTIRKTALAVSLVLLTSSPVLAENFLINIHTGPDNPTKAALGFIVALAAQNAGHHVDVFLAGDGASLITDDAISSVEGVGTGKLQEHFTALTGGDVRIYVSKASAGARNITDADLAGKPAEFATPPKLVELAAAADVVLAF